MRISDWSSDVCSSDLGAAGEFDLALLTLFRVAAQRIEAFPIFGSGAEHGRIRVEPTQEPGMDVRRAETPGFHAGIGQRSEEHTSELQSLMRISYAVFCLKKKNLTSSTTQSD